MKKRSIVCYTINVMVLRIFERFTHQLQKMFPSDAFDVRYSKGHAGKKTV